jgi:hypothetical protein
MNGEQCSNCRYIRSGSCRRWSPKVLGDSGTAIWPLVYLDDWCGEYEQKATQNDRIIALLQDIANDKTHLSVRVRNIVARAMQENDIATLSKWTWSNWRDERNCGDKAADDIMEYLVVNYNGQCTSAD